MSSANLVAEIHEKLWNKKALSTVALFSVLLKKDFIFPFHICIYIYDIYIYIYIFIYMYIYIIYIYIYIYFIYIYIYMYVCIILFFIVSKSTSKNFASVFFKYDPEIAPIAT